MQTTLCGQPPKVLQNFNVFQNEDEVNLLWTINAGNICLGIDIERAIGSSAFVRIGTIAGICGSPIENVSYAFVDDSPMSHTYSRYRLNMGVLGYSPEIAIRFVENSDFALVITPNPNGGNMILHFPKPLPFQGKAEFYLADGKLCDVITLSGNVNNYSISLNHQGEEHGTIYVVIKNNEGRIFASGKFIYVK